MTNLYNLILIYLLIGSIYGFLNQYYFWTNDDDFKLIYKWPYYLIKFIMK